MCGRYSLTLRAGHAKLRQLLPAVAQWPALEPRYNIGPGQACAAVRAPAVGGLEWLTWGWPAQRPGARPVINARAETITRISTFREALPDRRAVLPADGFYEWRDRQAYYFQLPEGEPFGLAALWTDGSTGPGPPRCLVLTTAPNPIVAPIHDRMPVVLDRAGCARWLAPRPPHINEPFPGFDPGPAGRLTVWPVGSAVHSVARDEPACCARVNPPRQLSLFPGA
ncbi:MAG: SOS response-associated peptidase [Candidatus Marinimicrobia bacterium]|nr:SOS response-associated peptidase [Candidatus Neomarinimicrobiota bacterium]